ncbi:MAG: M23 family metallopeptidase [Microbacteriaceae bacterium]
MAFAGMMLSLPTLPAQAEIVQEDAQIVVSQSLTVDDSAAMSAVETRSVTSDREPFTVREYSVVTRPVPAGTAISDGYGYRVPPCGGCSSFHKGADYLGGLGNDVRSISDGVVTEVGNPSGGLGVYVVVQHVIDGGIVSSVYAHMQYGSLALRVGQRVESGQIVGRVGSTGQSTGPHLYFEIRVGGTRPVDPVPWLAAHVNA